MILFKKVLRLSLLLIFLFPLIWIAYIITYQITNDPPSNTDAYNRLHGVVNDGDTANEITLLAQHGLKSPKLRFPPSMYVSVHTDLRREYLFFSPIRKGFAESAWITLNINSEHKLVLRDENRKDSDLPGHIELKFEAGRGVPPKGSDKLSEKYFSKQASETSDKPEWGLREYVIGDLAKDNWRYAYISTGERFKSVYGHPLFFSCGAGAPRIEYKNAASCINTFEAPGDVRVTYHFSARILPYWREIHQEILYLSNSILVK